MSSSLPAVKPASSIHENITAATHLPQSSATTSQPPLDLVRALCRGLDEQEIAYCHWKSNNALDRSASGENDLDLLISREDANRFTALLDELGFKQVVAPADKQIPGVVDYMGYDAPTTRLVHGHIHYQLTLGHDLSKNYRLPIEEAYIASSKQVGLFRAPAPEFEFIVLVIRLILKHSTWDVMLLRQGQLKSGERKELAYLRERIDPARVDEILDAHLPFITKALFQDCLKALEPGCSLLKRIQTGQRLQAALQSNGRRGMLSDALLKFWQRGYLTFRSRILRKKDAFRLRNGGITIALMGGDGSGKSTAIEMISKWLGSEFEITRMHMGKPAWSLATVSVRSLLKAGQVLGLYPAVASFRKTVAQQSPVSPGYPFMIRETMTARDRCNTYLHARRSAAENRVVLLDRFPLPQIRLMDGPQNQRFLDALQGVEAPQGKNHFAPRPDARLARYLVEREKAYYDRMALPEVRIVLRLNPEIAVQRKPEEDASFVRERNTEIWEKDWESVGVCVIDASQPRDVVAAQIRSIIWSQI